MPSHERTTSYFSYQSCACGNAACETRINSLLVSSYFFIGSTFPTISMLIAKQLVKRKAVLEVCLLKPRSATVPDTFSVSHYAAHAQYEQISMRASIFTWTRFY